LQLTRSVDVLGSKVNSTWLPGQRRRSPTTGCTRRDVRAVPFTFYAENTRDNADGRLCGYLGRPKRGGNHFNETDAGIKPADYRPLVSEVFAPTHSQKHADGSVYVRRRPSSKNGDANE